MGGMLLGEAKVKISYSDLNKLDAKIDDSGRKFVSQANKMTQALKGIGAIIGTIGIVKLGGDILAASTKMDTMNRMLINIEGSQAKANKRFEQFRILAKEPVLDPFNLSRFYVSLKSVNVEGELSIRFMKSLANAMAGVGAGNEEFARSMEQVVQMMGKGKLVGQDLRVIAESFPQIRKYLAEAFGGIVDPEELAKKGYTALDVLTKLNEAMEKSPKFAGGAQAAQDNFKQSLVLFNAALGKDLLPTFSNFLNDLTKLMDRFSELDEPMKKFIGKAVIGGMGLLGIASAVGAITTALNLLSISSGLKALTTVGAGVAGAGAVGAITKKWVPNVGGLAAAGYATGAYQDVAAGAGAGGIAAGIGRALPIAGAITFALGVGYFTGKALIASVTDATIVTKGIKQFSGELAIGKDELISKLSELKFGAGNVPGMKISELDIGILQREMIFGKAGLDWEIFWNRSVDQVLEVLDKKITKGTEGIKVNLPKVATIDDWSAIEKEAKKFTDVTSKAYKASDTEQLKFWQFKLGLPLTPEAKVGVLNTISDLQDDINKTLKEKMKDLASDQQVGWDLISKGYLDIMSEIGMKKVPIITETGALISEYQLPEGVERKPPQARKELDMLKLGWGPGEMETLRESAAEYGKELDQITKFDQDMLELAGKLEKQDELYIQTLQEQAQAFDKAGMSAENYAIILKNIQKNTEERQKLKVTLQLDDSLIDQLENIENKYKSLYTEAERLDIPKLMVDQAKESEIESVYEKWASGLENVGSAMAKVAADWDKLVDDLMGTEEIEKKQSAFWKNMSQETAGMAMAVSDKFIGSQFDRWFKPSRLKEAWKDYVKEAELAGQKVDITFEKFSDDYNAQLKLNSQSWKEFCQDMLKEFGKMLAKKLIMFTAEKTAEWAIEKMTEDEVEGIPASSANMSSSTSNDMFKTNNALNEYPEGSYAAGGIVTRPTIAMLGESGPEMVIPLNKGNSAMGGVNIQNMTIIVPDTWDRKKAENVVVQAFNDARQNNRI